MRGAFIPGSHLKTTPIGGGAQQSCISLSERELRSACRKEDDQDEEFMENA